MAACMKMGGILADASDEDLQNLYAYGETMGLAFQLQDDVLDVYGDTSVFGKKIGGDIVCNKKTFLLIKAMELASPEQRAELADWMAKERFDEQEKIARFTAIYNALGVRDLCEKRINELFAKCDEYIDKIALPAERKSNLRGFVDSLLNRNL